MEAKDKQQEAKSLIPSSRGFAYFGVGFIVNSKREEKLTMGFWQKE